MSNNYIIDTECYSNYWLLSLLSLSTGKVCSYELYDGHALDINAITKVMQTFTTISFNGNHYDLPMISAALKGYTNEQLKALSDKIITSKLPSYKVCQEEHILIPKKWDHIDLFEVAPGQGSLKIYGGRLGCEVMQDLPIEPNELINAKQREQLRDYCANDLTLTKLLYETLKSQLMLRVSMSEQYGMDLRSKSDAQIAETIIVSELEKLTDNKVDRPEVSSKAKFQYLDPKIVKFKSATLNIVFSDILSYPFTLGANGAVQIPEWLKGNKIELGVSSYQMGIGGLHSCESAQYVRADDDHLLIDLDVASYYPNIILQQQLAPKLMGKDFLTVYQSILTRRIKAKRDGDKVTSEVLKIAVNGSFGKLGSKYSKLYAPDLLIQSTITGQLCLLMLIERVEEVGAEVISANTDGIVIYCHKSLERKVQEVAWEWMLDTCFELERTDYKAIASRDVNNYLAVKLDGSVKVKGCFAKSGIAKNPDCSIIYSAVVNYIASGRSLSSTIRDCKDIMQFVTVRRVQGGAVWCGEYLGKAVRFYHSTSVPSTTCIHYKTNSNKVPKSVGCKPMMTVPGCFPDDIDYAYYEKEAEQLLTEVGV